MPNRFFILSLSCAALSLVGCRTFIDPTFVPTGYAHNAKYYKTAPGPEAGGIGYEYDAIANQQAVSRWVSAAGDMVDELQSKAGLGSDSIYIAQAPHSAFNKSFDYALRQALIERGFYVANTPESAAYEMSYEALPEKLESATGSSKTSKPYYNGDVGERKPYQPASNVEADEENRFVLTLNLSRGGTPLGSGSGSYELPPYGYGLNVLGQ